MAKKFFIEAAGLLLNIPVNPEEVQITVDGNVKTEETINLGDITIIGSKALEQVSFSSFLPAHRYPFVNRKAVEPESFCSIIRRFQELKSPVRLIITDTSINMQCAISSFNYKLVGGTNDYEYSISFQEYKTIGIKEVNIPLSPPPVQQAPKQQPSQPQQSQQTQTVKAPAKPASRPRENVNKKLCIGVKVNVIGEVFRDADAKQHFAYGGANAFALVRQIVPNSVAPVLLYSVNGTTRIGFTKRESVAVVG